VCPAWQSTNRFPRKSTKMDIDHATTSSNQHQLSCVFSFGRTATASVLAITKSACFASGVQFAPFARRKHRSLPFCSSERNAQMRNGRFGLVRRFLSLSTRVFRARPQGFAGRGSPVVEFRTGPQAPDVRSSRTLHGDGIRADAVSRESIHPRRRTLRPGNRDRSPVPRRNEFAGGAQKPTR